MSISSRTRAGVGGKTSQERKELIHLLRDPVELEKKLEIRQFGILEPMREHIPGAWRALVATSSVAHQNWQKPFLEGGTSSHIFLFQKSL